MSLHGAYDDANIFAKILAGDAPCVKVFEDEHALAFMDIFPQSKGHCLVVPKEKARNLLELSDEAAREAISRVKKLTQAVENALSPDGVTVVQFNGGPAGQTVFHIHFHVIPRWEGQDIKGHAGGEKADPAELERLADRIRAAL
ncbi:MAG: HIT family protein [Oceanicaulis sp.]